MRCPRAAAVVLLISLCVSGCAPVLILGAGAAGAGAIVWHGGWVKQTLDTPHDRVLRPARSALGDLDVVLEDETSEADRGVLDGYDRESRRVMVKTKAAGEKTTEIRIRVGLWGDQARSLRILEQLKKHL